MGESISCDVFMIHHRFQHIPRDDDVHYRNMIGASIPRVSSVRIIAATQMGANAYLFIIAFGEVRKGRGGSEYGMFMVRACKARDAATKATHAARQPAVEPEG